MLRLAANYVLISLSEASRVLGLTMVDVIILMALDSGPERLRVMGLADSLNIPRETCRRRVHALRAAGWIQKDRLALPPAHEHPHHQRLMECLAMVERQARRFEAHLAAQTDSVEEPGVTEHLATLDLELAGSPSRSERKLRRLGSDRPHYLK